jgi:hypothetical protein
MNHKQQRATWAYVSALAVLFVFCLAQPRSWQRHLVTHRRSASVPSATLVTTTTGRSNIAKPVVARAEVQNADRGRSVDWQPSAPKGVLTKRRRLDAGKRAESTESQNPQQVCTPQLAFAEAPLVASDEGANPSVEAPSPGAVNDEPLVGATAPIRPASVVEVAGSNQVAARRPVFRRPRRIARANGSSSHRVWGEPDVLLDHLDRLAGDCDAGLWPVRVADVVRELCRTDDLQSPRTALTLKRLRDLVEPNHPLLALPSGSQHTGELRRLRYAVVRRLDLWELVPELAEHRSRPDVRNQTVSLAADLPRSPEPPANVARLLSHLERFEQTGLTDDGRDLVSALSQLTSRDEKLAARTERWLEWNYRNANLRIVFTQQLLNRLVPVQPAVEEPIHDRIMGVPTRGWSTSTARLSIRLIPDPEKVRFALEAKGIVLARTASRRDPVTVYTNSDSAYVARKQLQLSAEGLQDWPTQAEVNNNSRLRGIETDYDDVPIFGPLVEGIARAKHAESEPAVRRVARRKVAARVQEEVDAAIAPKLAQARQLYRDRVLTPLEALSMAPAIIEMQTSEERLTARLRLAGDEQLAASTPRPMALSDSLASVQLHQSLANNICDRLDLDGHSFTLPELQLRFVKAFKLAPGSLPEDYPDDLRVTFAKRDALVVRFDEGRVELSLGVAELHKYPKTWRDFQVRVYYRPRLSGLDIRFVRDGTVQLRGEHFGHEPQIALRGIFSKVFSHDREVALIGAGVLADPRLASLGVTQCVLTDGWLGLSVGAASSPRQAQRHVGPLY